MPADVPHVNQVELDSRAGAVGRGRRSRVAGRRHGRRADPQFFGLAHRRRQPARLEGAGGVEPLLFHVHPAQPQPPANLLERQQRGHALSERHDVRGIVDGHDFPVPPHRRLAARELVPRYLRADALQIVARKEHLAASGAKVVQGIGRVLSVAVGAFEVAQIPHRTGPPPKRKSPRRRRGPSTAGYYTIPRRDWEYADSFYSFRRSFRSVGPGSPAGLFFGGCCAWEPWQWNKKKWDVWGRRQGRPRAPPAEEKSIPAPAWERP